MGFLVGLGSEVALPEWSDAELSGEGRPDQPHGKAKLLFEAPRGVPEPIDASYPLILLSA